MSKLHTLQIQSCYTQARCDLLCVAVQYALAVSAIEDGASVDTDTTALVRRVVVEIWNQGNLALADRLFTSDYVNHAGLITDLVAGPEAVKVSIAFYRSAFPDFQIGIDALMAKRDAVLLRWTAQSVAGAGSLSGILVCRIVANQIAESWVGWNQVAGLAQFGLDPHMAQTVRLHATARG
jgi:hypothetical protein